MASAKACPENLNQCVFYDDGGRGVYRVRRYGVLHASRRARTHSGGTQVYWIGEKAGEQAPGDAKLPTAAELNMVAQKYFTQQGSGNKSDWNLAFERGYEDGFKKTHQRQ